MKWQLGAVLALLPACAGLTVKPLLPAPSGGFPRNYTLAPGAIQVFSADVGTVIPPRAPCPSKCPVGGRIACSGSCPAGCSCYDGWGLYFDIDAANNDPRGLAFAVSRTSPASDAALSQAYSLFAAGDWNILPFVTAYEHMVDAGISRTEAVAWTKQNELELGTVNLCRWKGTTKYAEVECGCDDCSETCGVRDSRKWDSCPASEAQFAPQYGQGQGCTYYAAATTVIHEAFVTDYCCNAVPSAFEADIGALEQHAHAHDWRPTPKVLFPTWTPKLPDVDAGVRHPEACNRSTGKEAGRYAVGRVAVSRCSASQLPTGKYYLYVVNTANESQVIQVNSVRATAITRDETNICWAVQQATAPSSSGAVPFRASLLGLVLAVTLAWCTK